MDLSKYSLVELIKLTNRINIEIFKRYVLPAIFVLMLITLIIFVVSKMLGAKRP
jgi:hypothetical protein